MHDLGFLFLEIADGDLLTHTYIHTSAPGYYSEKPYHVLGNVALLQLG